MVRHEAHGPVCEASTRRTGNGVTRGAWTVPRHRHEAQGPASEAWTREESGTTLGIGRLRCAGDRPIEVSSLAPGSRGFGVDLSKTSSSTAEETAIQCKLIGFQLRSKHTKHIEEP